MLYNLFYTLGVPSCQRTVAFEKACVLFNMGAIYTQIGAKQDRSTTKGLDAAVDNFLRAAGTFRYIHENFTNAPSMDLGPNMLEMFVQLMLVRKNIQKIMESRLCIPESYVPSFYSFVTKIFNKSFINHFYLTFKNAP